MRIALATTVLPGLDHIGPLERHQTDITVLRRAEDLAELLAIARSGLVDAVLVAGDTESLTAAFLEETARLPRPVGVAALSEVRAERRRLRGMGVPCVRADADPEQIAAVVVESASAAVEGRRPETSHGEDADHARDHGEDLDDLPITLETLGEDEVPGLTDPWRDADEPDVAGPGAAPAAATSDDGPATADEGADPAPSPEGDEPAEPARESSLVTVVWGPTGAPGRTTVAVNLAAEHAVAGRNTLLVDLDTYGPAVGVHLGLTEESAGVARAVRRADHGRLGAADLAAAGVRVRVAGADLTVLTGLTRVDRWPELRPAAVTALIAAARERWDRVVVDVGFGLEQDEELSFDVPAPQRNGATLAALAAADEVIAVGGPDAVALPRLVRGVEELAEVAPAARPRVVVNRLRPAAAGVAPRAQVEAVWNRYASPATPLEAFLPWDPAAADPALLAGQVLAEAAPNSPLRRALATLAGVPARPARRGRHRARPPQDIAAASSDAARDATGTGRPARHRTLIPWSVRSRRTP
ncbi:MinD/ParA family protein [Micrococcus luteus]|uniref:MinD/ParA family protein n=1 Tax=Micrococcus luteus TaxID=1270 RepID=UPI0037A1AFF7